MTTVHDQFVGAADEATYGDATAPTDFFEILTESITGTYERIESEAIRGPILRLDRWAPNPKGAAGDLEYEVLDKGTLSFWLKHMLGSVDTSVPGTFTATVGDTVGQSFTVQVARDAVGGNLIPFTYSGGKVTEWEISAEVDGILKARVACDFALEAIGANGLALATPTYPAGAQLLTFIGGDVAVGGTGFPVSSFTLSGNNGLKVDRYAMRGANSTTKREPQEESLKEFGLTMAGEFEDDSHSQRVAAAVASGAVADVTLNFDSPQGGTVSVTLPAVRWDEAPVNAAREVTTQEITAKVLAPETGEPVTVTVVEPA